MTAETAIWQVVAVTDGYALETDEIAELADDTVEDVRIMIVRGSAAPANDHGRYLRTPSSGHEVCDPWYIEDVADEWGWFDDRDQFDRRWVQAQAMAAGLNAVTTK